MDSDHTKFFQHEKSRISLRNVDIFILVMYKLPRLCTFYCLVWERFETHVRKAHFTTIYPFGFHWWKINFCSYLNLWKCFFSPLYAAEKVGSELCQSKYIAFSNLSVTCGERCEKQFLKQIIVWKCQQKVSAWLQGKWKML